MKIYMFLWPLPDQSDYSFCYNYTKRIYIYSMRYRDTQSDCNLSHNYDLLHWCVHIRFSWRHTSDIRGESLATVVWDIPPDVTPGTYQIHHYGHHKTFNLFSESEYCCVLTASM